VHDCYGVDVNMAEEEGTKSGKCNLQ